MGKEITTEDTCYIKFMEEVAHEEFRYNIELITLIKEFIESLPGRKKRIAILRYGLDGNKPHSIARISKILLDESEFNSGLSVHSIREHLSQIRRNFWSCRAHYKDSLLAHEIMQYAIKKPEEAND